MGEHEMSGLLRMALSVGLAAVVVLTAITLLGSSKSNSQNIVNKQTETAPNLVALPNHSLVKDSVLVTGPHTNNTVVTGSNGSKMEDVGKDEAKLTIPAGKGTTHFGPYFGVGGNSSNQDNSTIWVGDKWRTSALIKTDDPSHLAWSYMGVESSDNTKYLSNPKFSTSYRLYESSGVRKDTYGTFVIYFINKGTKPINVWIKDPQLYRAEE